MFAIKCLLPNITKPIAIKTITTTATLNGSLKPPQKLTTLLGISTDRTQTIPLETSLKYLKSKAYKQTYGEDPVWVPYRRNHKGAIPPRKTRKTCIRGGHISTGNPCPICRDEYLVLHENNTALLNQFISPQTGAILSYKQTGLCQKKHQELQVAIAKARDIGTITFDVPFRKYNYADYYKE
ncbi:small ribosomal subunit protein mS40 [Atheta coriaria]|uniref:small ribosomal subunit protein mS40 n=1 Tax=Dalotia coriaria TaxID=877792 RepID=UPI0031F34103